MAGRQVRLHLWPWMMGDHTLVTVKRGLGRHTGAFGPVCQTREPDWPEDLEERTEEGTLFFLLPGIAKEKKPETCTELFIFPSL